MNREDIIRMAREAGCVPVRHPEYDNDVQVFATPDVLERFAVLVAAAERERFNALLEDYHVILETLEEMQAAVTAEREACAKVAGWLWQQFQDTKEAHERNSPEPFRPERFGFDQSTVQQSKRLMDAINARSQA